MSRARRACRALAVLVALGIRLATPAVAQDFAAPEPAGPGGGALALLEVALPAGPPASFESAATRWWGLPEWTTAAAAVSGGHGAIRAAAGLSRTGPEESGWGAAGLACGMAAPGAGAALRIVARRDRAPDALVGPVGRGVGLEAGGGAWVAAGPGLVAWARAPQIWTRGAAPPLARGLALGARWEDGGTALWIERAAPARPADGTGRHLLGVSLHAGPGRVWAEVRDGPPRGAVGVGVRGGALFVAARVEAHPSLGDTVTLALGLAAAGDGP